MPCRQEVPMKSIHPWFLVVVSLALVLAACAPLSTGSAVMKLPAPVTPTPRPAHFPVGRFVSASEPSLVVLSVQNDGRFRLFMDNTELDAGLFVSEGDQVRVES